MNGPTWAIDKDDRMIVNVYQSLYDYENGTPCIRISVHEIIEHAGRTAVMEHVRECDRSEWLVDWQKEKHDEFIDLLTK